MKLDANRIWNQAHQVVGERLLLSSVLVLIASAALTAGLLWSFQENLSSLEERAGYLPWTVFPDDVKEERVAIVAIDERSINEIGPWPWSREVMAELVRSINAAGALLQIHDVLYPEGDRSGNQDFSEALLEGQKSIVAQLPILQSQDGSLESGGLTHSVSGIECISDGGHLPFPTSGQFIGAHSMLGGVPKGHIAPIIDRDGSVRRVPAFVCSDTRAYPALAVSPFFQMTSPSRWEAEIVDGQGLFEPSRVLKISSYPGLEIPLDEDGALRISFKKSPNSFTAVSAIDVLEGNLELPILDNVLVMVGATAFGLDDIVPTPYSGFAPGVELQARVLTSVLDGEVPYTPIGVFIFVTVVSLVIGVGLLLTAIQRGRIALLGLPFIAAFSSLFALMVHGLLLTQYDIWIGWLYSGVFGFMGGSFLLVVEHVRVRFERGIVMQNLASYLPEETARRVAYQLPTSAIQAERREVTLMSADLRNFSALGESRPPEESASVLHFFFTKVSEIVESTGGRVHEYNGDSVLAVWDGGGCDSASRALEAAILIESQVNTKWLPEVHADGLEPLAVGVGIEQGPVVLGSIGPAHRRANALCGDTVTVTLRIQEMTAELSCPILLGEVAARYLPDAKLYSLGNYLLPGLINTHSLYSPSAKELPQSDGLRLLMGGLEDKKSADFTG